MQWRIRRMLWNVRQIKSDPSLRLLGMLAVISLVVVYRVWGPDIRYYIAKQRVKKYGEALTSLCLGHSSANEEMPVGTEDVPKLLVIQQEAVLRLRPGQVLTLHKWHDELPDEWRAKDSNDVDFVVCVRKDRVEIRSCSYARPGSSSVSVTITSYRSDYIVTMIDSENGRAIASHRLMGNPIISGDCPEYNTTDTKSRTSEGILPPFSDFMAWLDN